MSKPKRNHKKTYEEWMRQADEGRPQTYLNRLAITQIDFEIESLAAKIAVTGNMQESITLKAELVHLRSIRDQLAGIGRRKPPESGIPVPAVPPRGPLPKQGGAEAPLDFSD